MKKLIALVLAALMLCTVSLAFAGILEPTGKLAGATVNATVGDYDEETKTFIVTLYEYDRYDEAEIAKLAVGDTIVAGGQLHTIKGTEDVNGTLYYLCDDGEEICFGTAYDDLEGLIARSSMDDRIFMHVMTVLQLPAAEGIVYEDNSNPDLDAEMVIIEGLEDILKAKAEAEETSNGFDGYATKITLNEQMEIVKIHRDFDVAQ